MNEVRCHSCGREAEFRRSLSALLTSARVGAMIKPVSMRHRDRAMYRRQIRSGDGGGGCFRRSLFPSRWDRASRARRASNQLCTAFSQARVVRHEIGANRHTSITLMWCRRGSAGPARVSICQRVLRP